MCPRHAAFEYKMRLLQSIDLKVKLTMVLKADNKDAVDIANNIEYEYQIQN